MDHLNIKIHLRALKRDWGQKTKLWQAQDIWQFKERLRRNPQSGRRLNVNYLPPLKVIPCFPSLPTAISKPWIRALISTSVLVCVTFLLVTVPPYSSIFINLTNIIDIVSLLCSRHCNRHLRWSILETASCPPSIHSCRPP